MQNKNIDDNNNLKSDKVDKSNKNKVNNFNENDSKEESNNKLKKYIYIVVLCIVGLELVLNYAFNIQFEIKIIVEVVSIILSSLVILGVVKSDKKQEDVFKTKTEIEKSILEEVEKFKNKK